MPTGALFVIIDEEERLRPRLAQVLKLEGYTVMQAPDAHRGLELLQQHAADNLIVLSDVKLLNANDVDLLPVLSCPLPKYCVDQSHPNSLFCRP